MACMSAERSLAATGEGLRLASGDDTDVASVVVSEVKSMGSCAASCGGEVACDVKSVESPTGAAVHTCRQRAGCGTRGGQVGCRGHGTGSSETLESASTP
ncbi:hypothetical protein MTO96_024786 [Rhipicephalus appendiculatus]